MEDDENRFPWLRDIRRREQMIADMDCVHLAASLNSGWDLMPEVWRHQYLSEMVKKNCEHSSVTALLLKQLQSRDPYYRSRALELIRDVVGVDGKRIFIEIADPKEDEEVVEAALRCLTDLFRDRRDREILSLAYQLYVDPKTSIQLKFTAAATMMYQLGIPHDEFGRPAWWDAEDESMDHPAIQRAVAETKEILRI